MQPHEAFDDLARNWKTLYDSLTVAGFMEEQALRLTETWIKALFGRKS